MASRKQIAANRRNAQLSTGPKTEKGKAAVRGNALKHGLTANLVVVDGEDSDNFIQLRREFEEHFQPVGPVECALVQQIVIAQWRLARLRGMETGLFDLAMIDYEDDLAGDYQNLQPHDRFAYVFDRKADTFNLYGRYETRIERSFYRALHELQRLQSARTQPPAPGPQAVAPQPSAAEQTQFDPQTPPNRLNPNDLSTPRLPVSQSPGLPVSPSPRLTRVASSVRR